MFKPIGNFITKNRIWIILAWVILAAFMLVFAPSLKEVGKLDNTAFLPEDTQSSRGQELMDRYFPSSVNSSASLIFYAENGLTEDDLAAAQAIWTWLNSAAGAELSINSTTSIFDNPGLESTLISPDRTTMIMNVGTSGALDNEVVIQGLREHLTSSDNLQIYVSGEGGILSDLQEAVLHSLDRTTLITILLVIVLLLIIYRSPVASLVPLITIGAAYLVSRGALGFIAQAGVSVWSQLDAMVIVLVFGVGTDYCLFMVSRFREELKLKDSRVAAMRQTVGKVGIVITASAFTVIIGLCGMAIARFEMLKTMGPLMGLTVFITLLAALTLAPAMASIMGKYLFWPSHEHRSGDQPRSGKKPFFHKVADLATGKPARVIGVVLIILAIPCAFYPQFNRSFDQTEEVPSQYDSIQGFRVLEKHYNIGEMEPVNLILAAPEGTDLTDAQYLAALAQSTRDLSRVEGVLNVKSILNPQGGSEPLEALTVSGQLNTLGAALDINGGDIQALFDPATTQGFQSVGNYLNELGTEFKWIQEEAAYQEALSSLDSLLNGVVQIKTGASVSYQLQTLTAQLNQAGTVENPASTGNLDPEEAGRYLQVIASYLDELGQQYPDIQSGADYQGALEICRNGLAAVTQLPALSPEEQAAAGAQLQAGLPQLKAALTSLSGTFAGKDAYLISTTLAAASGTDSSAAAATLQSGLSGLQSRLTALSGIFQEHDNPVFLSATLLESSPELQSVVDLFVSQDHRATRMYVVLDSFPASDKALQTIDKLRGSLDAAVSGSVLNGCETGSTGTTATYADIQHIIDSDFNHIMILVVICTFLVLVALLRSLLAPLYLLAAVVISYFAAMGFSTLIFQNLLGQDGINFIIPIVTFVLLVALGSDYNIFLMSRIREEAESRGTREGTRIAARATGAIILACGVILAGTFSALASSPIRFMLQLGVTVAIGVLVDTAIMQLFLLPAIARLLGKWTWWPAKERKKAG